MSSTISASDIHLILTGFPYPRGMAGTKRMQHAIDALRSCSGVSAAVLCTRQSSMLNTPSGDYNGVQYTTIMPDASRTAFILAYPSYAMRARKALRRLIMPDMKGVLWIYGFLNFDTLPLVLEARRCGYKIVCDIVEDGAAARDMLAPLPLKLRALVSYWLTRCGTRLVDGYCVITSRLYDKVRDMTNGGKPLLKRPISVDMACFPEPRPSRSGEIRLLYAGSFGVKDGVECLIDAFDRVAADIPSLRLVLVGQPDKDRQAAMLQKISDAAFADRIISRGYLDDDAYYAELREADVMCMTRIDHSYAHAGFPFKLGEYLASGKPVIASAVSEIPEFLTNGESALLVKPGDVDDLVRGIRQLLSDPGRAIAIGLHGREVALQHFCYQAQAAPLYAFIKRLWDVTDDDAEVPSRYRRTP